MLLGGRELDADNVSLELQTVIGESRTLTLGSWRNWLGDRAGDTVLQLAGRESAGDAAGRKITRCGHCTADETERDGREPDADTVVLALLTGRKIALPG